MPHAVIPPPVTQQEESPNLPAFVATSRSRVAAPKSEQGGGLYVLAVVGILVIVAAFLTYRPFDRESYLQEQEATEEFFAKCEACGLTRAEVVHIAKQLSDKNYSQQKVNHTLAQLPRIVTATGGSRHFRRMMVASNSELIRHTSGMSADDTRLLIEFQQAFPSSR